MGMWEDYQTSVQQRMAMLQDPGYLSWRRRRRLISLGLVILTVVLVSPLLLVLQFFQVRSILGFACIGVSVALVLVFYRVLGWAGRPYTPPAAGTSPGWMPPAGTPSRVVSSSAIPVVEAWLPPAGTTGSVFSSAVAPPMVAGPASPGTAVPSPMMGAPSPSPTSSGCSIGLAIAGLILVLVLSCGGIIGLAGWFLTRAPSPVRPAAPFERPGFGANEQLQRIQRENQQRMEQMQRDQERRLREMQQRQQEMLERSRRSFRTP